MMPDATMGYVQAYVILDVIIVQILKMQNCPDLSNLTKMSGIEYGLIHYQDPILYIIQVINNSYDELMVKLLFRNEKEDKILVVAHL